MSIYSSNPPGVTSVLATKFAFIAGAGGLGSNLAIMLARAGVGRLLICDFDVVTEANLNRQAYFLEQVGMRKVDALKENIKRINPEINVNTINDRLMPANFAKYIPDNTDIIFECFDDASAKANLFSFCISEKKKIPLLMVSGLAGTDKTEKIVITKIMSNVWLIGDQNNAMSPELGTLSSRVMTASAMQAHLGIRILLGLEEVYCHEQK